MVNGIVCVSGSIGSETSVTRSSATFIPILFPPPGFVKNDRPSSAARAFAAPDGVTVLLGRSGAGKSTLVNALLGAERVIVIDRYDYRLHQVEKYLGAETLNYEEVEVGAELRERSGGRGPDVCIEAVGMEAHSTGPQFAYDQLKQQLRLQTDRPVAVRDAIHACRKGGTVFVLGVFAGFIDKFPLGALMNKGLTVRGAQMHGQRYIPMLLERMERGELVTEHLATHTMPLTEGPRGYELFKRKEDGNIRSVFLPGG